MKTIVQIILAILVVVLGYLLFRSVLKPIEFKNEQEKRYDATISKLKDIRTAQEVHKSVKGYFTPYFDTLIHFVNNDSIPLENITRVKDYNTDSLTKEKAIKLGYYEIKTINVSIKDSLFKHVKYSLTELDKVPYTNGAAFNMDTASVEAGNVKVPVFEASVKNYVLLDGLNKQLSINFNDKWKMISGGYPGLKVGSLTEATNNAGNWD